MIPVYDPKSFAGVDLRKYHIRDIADVLKFLEFVEQRLSEAAFVVKKFNTQYSTYRSLAKQLQNKVEKEQQAFGNPTLSATQSHVQRVVEEEDAKTKADAAIRESLLDDIRQAAAEESVKPAVESGDNERLQAEIDKYKAVAGKNRVMYYREGKMVSEKDVPEDIKQQLLDVIEGKHGQSEASE